MRSFLEDSRVSASIIARDLGDLRWKFSGTTQIGYLGWIRRGNFGDDAMFQAFRRAVRNLSPVLPAPLTKVGRTLAKGARADLLVVGGGTLLGLPEWNERISLAIDALKPDRIVCLGTGVVPPSSIKGVGDQARHIRDTASILKTFDNVMVRGPRSASSLSSVGIDATVVGDLALLGADAFRVRPASQRKLILVNLANNAQKLHQSALPEASIVGSALDSLADSGYEIRFFGMENKDLALVGRLQSRNVEIVHHRGDLDLLGLIASADLVISERLHGAILAASVGVPFVALPYMDKVFDFASTIGALGRVLEAHDLEQSAILQRRLLDVMADTPGQKVINRNVQGLAAGLAAEVKNLIQ